MQLVFIVLVWLACAGATTYYISTTGADNSTCQTPQTKCANFSYVFGLIDSAASADPSYVFVDPGEYNVTSPVSTSYQTIVHGNNSVVNCLSASNCISLGGGYQGSEIAFLTFYGGNPTVDVASEGVVIINCVFKQGGRALSVGGSVQNFRLTNVSFDSRQLAPSDSVAVLDFNNVNHVQIQQTTFENFLATYGTDPTTATAVALRAVHTAEITDCTFKNNYGQHSALIVSGTGTSLVVERSVFTNNTATVGNGGALQVTAPLGTTQTLNVSDCEFESNAALGSTSGGGAVYATSYLTPALFVTNCTFRNNHAGQGGAVGAQSATVELDGSKFFTNYANTGGAIIGTTIAKITIKNCLFTGNNVTTESDPNGGAVYSDTQSGFNVQGSIFRNNTAGESGGAIFTANILQVSNSSFYGNTANSMGAAIHIESLSGQQTIASSNFTWNYSPGGAVSTYSSVTITTSQFMFNHANNGGGIYAATSSVVLTTVNCSFYNCTATNAGGAVYANDCTFQDTDSTATLNYAPSGGAFFFTSASVTLVGTNFSGNTGTNGGAGLATDGNIMCNGCHFSKNTAESGAGFSIAGSTALPAQSFDLCEFSDNTANKGGAIFGDQISLILTSSQMMRNTATGSGGAMYVSNSNITTDLSKFEDNHGTTNHGGAIYLSSTGQATFTTTNFTNNYVPAGFGGAIYLDINQHVRINDCTFSNNSAVSSSGGGIFVDGGVLTLSQAHFENNNADNSGGAIYVISGFLQDFYSVFSNNYAAKGGAISMNSGQLSLLGTNFTLNNAGVGGAVAVYYINVSITNCSFSQNNASSQGGAIMFAQTDKNTPVAVVFQECNFTGNYAAYGAGIYLTNTPLFSMSTLRFQNNIAGIQGGGLYATGANFFALNFEFLQNQAVSSGGGIYLFNCVAQFTNPTISNNYATIGGGVCLQSGGNGTILNATISRNQAKQGGGVGVLDSSAVIKQSNISFNQATLYGGGVYLEANMTIQDCVIDGNNDTGIYINSWVAEQGLVVDSTTLTNTGPFEFCCAGIPLKNMTQRLCNYPSCNSRCGGTNGTCNCTAQSTPPCTNCTAPYIGAFCNYIDECQQPGFCNRNEHYCSHDSQYFSACCPTLQNCFLGNCYLGCSANATCDSNANCKCYSGFSGDGFTCILNSSATTTTTTTGTASFCGGITCSTHAICVDNTCKCSFGYSGTGVVCDAIDECNPNNGGCDYHTNCTSMIGYSLCSNCPTGFVFANGNTTCFPLCGDNDCNASIGENCVTCPADCHPSPCNQCGDKHCDQGSETCATCSEDCGLCLPPPCTDPTCSGHGHCQSGVCICNNQWSGPTCSKNNAPIQVNISQPGTGSDPGLSVTPTGGSKGSEGVAFTLAITALNEIDEARNFVQGINLASQNFTFVPVTSPSPPAPSGPCQNCSLPSYLSSSTPFSCTTNKQYLLSTPLNNTAYFEMMIFQFNDQETSITFAQNASTYIYNTIKLAIQVRSWPFRSLRNSLSIVFASPQTSLSTSSCSQVDKNTDENNNLKWLAININGSTLYGTFLDTSLVDGNLRVINFTLNSDYSVSAILPHFWTNAVVDPNFSVLLEDKPKNCESNTKNGKTDVKKIVEIVVPVVVVVVILAVVGLIYFWPKIQERREVYHANKRFTGGKQLESESTKHLKQKQVEIEKVDSMNVHSSAGNFHVDL